MATRKLVVTGFQSNPLALFLPQDVQSLSRLPNLIRLIGDSSWKVRFVALVWLSRFLLLPFPVGKALPLLASVKAECYSRLSLAGNERKAACIFLGSWYCRPEVGWNEFFGLFQQQLANSSSQEYFQLALLKISRFLLRSSSVHRTRENALAISTAVHAMVADGFQSASISICRSALKLLTAVAISFYQNSETVRLLSECIELLGSADFSLRSISAECVVALLKKFSMVEQESIFVQILTPPAQDAFELHGLLYFAGQSFFSRCQFAIHEPAQVAKFCAPLLVDGPFYENPSVPSSLCSSIRDSFCFLMWSVAKRVTRLDGARELFSIHLESLICVALFDSDVNCRRAAAACLQEWVGKGAFPFESGLQMIQLITFNSVHSRDNCYQCIAVEVAKIEPLFLDVFSSHLLQRKRLHADEQIRSLAATAFASLNSRTVPTELLAGLKSTNPLERDGSLKFLTPLSRQNSIGCITFDIDSLYSGYLGPMLCKSALGLIFELCKAHSAAVESYVAFSEFVIEEKFEEQFPLVFRALSRCKCSDRFLVWNEKAQSNIGYFYCCLSQHQDTTESFFCKFLAEPDIGRISHILGALLEFFSSKLQPPSCLYEFSKRFISIQLNNYTVSKGRDAGIPIRLASLKVYQFLPSEFQSDELVGIVHRLSLEPVSLIREAAFEIIKLDSFGSPFDQFFNTLGSPFAAIAILGVLKSAHSNQEEIATAFKSFQPRFFDLLNAVTTCRLFIAVGKLFFYLYSVDNFPGQIPIDQVVRVASDMILINESLFQSNFLVLEYCVECLASAGAGEQLASLLTHPFPRIRKLAKEHLAVLDQYPKTSEGKV